jgi:hypothetical protein
MKLIPRYGGKLALVPLEPVEELVVATVMPVVAVGVAEGLPLLPDG